MFVPICSFRVSSCFVLCRQICSKTGNFGPGCKKRSINGPYVAKKSARIWILFRCHRESALKPEKGFKSSKNVTQFSFQSFHLNTKFLFFAKSCPFWFSSSMAWDEITTVMLDTLSTSTEMSSSSPSNVVEASQVETSTSEGSPERDDAVSSCFF